jgi:membrane protein
VARLFREAPGGSPTYGRSMSARVRATARRLHRDSRALLHGHDLALASAGAAFYGALCVVPSVLVAVSLAQIFLGRSGLHRYGSELAAALPPAIGADAAALRLLDAGVTLSPLGIVLAIVMGSAYGEGLSRALTRFAPVHPAAKPRALWLRAASLPLLGLAPLLLAGLLLAAPWLGRTAGGGSPLGVALASYVSLTLVWVLTWAPLTWTFRVVGPGRLSWRAAFVGALVTGAFVSGFLQGFLLFCSLPIDLARPFGGLLGVGVACALLLWLWILHVVVLVGYSLTWAMHGLLEERVHRNVPAPRAGPLRADDVAGETGEGDYDGSAVAGRR